jgi:hypothetical protein
MRGGQQHKPRHRGRYQRGADRGGPSFVDVGLAAAGPESEMRVQIRPPLVEVNQHYALAELGEIHRKIDRHEALAHTPTSAPDCDDVIRGARRGVVGLGGI